MDFSPSKSPGKSDSFTELRVKFEIVQIVVSEKFYVSNTFVSECILDTPRQQHPRINNSLRLFICTSAGIYSSKNLRSADKRLAE